MSICHVGVIGVIHKMRHVMVLNSGNSLLLCCSQWWAVCVWYLGLSWSPGCSCWLWGQRPEWPPTTKLAFVHDHLLSPQATVKVSQHLPISYDLYNQVWSLTRLVRTHSRKHWCFGDLTDSTLADDDAKIKSFEDSSFRASLALAFSQFSDRARGYPQIPLRKNSAKNRYKRYF